jgi:hypothetical protein
MWSRYNPWLAAGFVALLALAPAPVTAQQAVALRDSIPVKPIVPVTSSPVAEIINAKAATAVAAKAIADAEAETKKEQERLREIEKNFETLRFGLSLGWRRNITSTVGRDVAIDPATNVVVADTIDRGAFILSGVVAAHPWRNRELVSPNSNKPKTALEQLLSNAWRLGFIANLNVAEFTPSNVQTFNKSLEGGIGVTVKLNEEFAFASTFERLFGRRLRSFVVPGKVLKDKNGDPVTSLSVDDNTYFHDDHMTTLSFKFVYYIK